MERESHTCVTTAFPQKLHSHQKNQHEGSAKFECLICGFEFNSFWHLDNHSNTHLETENFSLPFVYETVNI